MSRRRDTKLSQPSPKKKPSLEDLSAGAIRSWVFMETIQHPATILPAAGAVVSALGAGVTGMYAIGIAATFGLVFVSGASWIYNYVICGEQLARSRTEELHKEREAWDENQLSDLVTRCSAAGFADGAKEGSEVLSAFRALMKSLAEREGGSGLSSRIQSLAREGLKEAVTLISRALAAQEAIDATDEDTLRKELTTMKRSLGRMNDSDRSSERRSLESRMASHESRLKSVADGRKDIESYLTKADEIEASLERARLESIELTDDQMPVNGEAATRLERAVASAKRVEQRLRGSVREDDGSDDEYLEAGQQTH